MRRLACCTYYKGKQDRKPLESFQCYVSVELDWRTHFTLFTVAGNACSSSFCNVFSGHAWVYSPNKIDVFCKWLQAFSALWGGASSGSNISIVYLNTVHEYMVALCIQTWTFIFGLKSTYNNFRHLFFTNLLKRCPINHQVYSLHLTPYIHISSA